MYPKSTLHCLLLLFQPKFLITKTTELVDIQARCTFWKKSPASPVSSTNKNLPPQHILTIVESGVKHHTHRPNLTSAVARALFV